MFPFGTRARHMSRKLSALVNDEDDDDENDEKTRALGERHGDVGRRRIHRRHVSISAFIFVGYDGGSSNERFYGGLFHELTVVLTEERPLSEGVARARKFT